MRVLHLGLEDHRRPGAGGGSHRNQAINSRLAALGHEIDFVAAAYPGARARVDDGVPHRHVGVPKGRYTETLSYQAAMPGVVARAVRGPRRPDLIVEEFAPPWSSLGVGHWTSVPTAGMVNGYFAAEKARQFKLPVRLMTAIEAWGTRSHRHLITVSEEIARRLRRVAPAAAVEVVGLGLDYPELDAALAPGAAESATEIGKVVFLGRLERDQKGLDLLLDAFTRCPTSARLVIAGDGHDAPWLRERIADLGFADRIELPGRVTGAQKWQLLASAQVFAMPSRYETFGLTALEAQACGTPVLAFDIPALRDTVNEASNLVTSFDAGAFGDRLSELLMAPEECERIGKAAGRRARGQSWDELARRQERIYEEAADGA